MAIEYTEQDIITYDGHGGHMPKILGVKLDADPSTVLISLNGHTPPPGWGWGAWGLVTPNEGDPMYLAVVAHKCGPAAVIGRNLVA